MGMFTTIIHPVDGRDLQIKCGNDTCETYKLGDDVGQYAIKDWAGSGYLLDDVYHGYGDPHAFVIIKGGKVVEVIDEEPAMLEAAANVPLGDDIGIDDCIEWLRKSRGVEDPPRSWWPEEAWAAKAARDERFRKEQTVWEASVAHLSPQDRLGAAMARSLSRQMGYASIARKVFQVEPMPEVAKPYYDKNEGSGMRSTREVCPTCERGAQYAGVCSNPFHLCRACVWEDGARVEGCLDCKAEEARRVPALAEELDTYKREKPRLLAEAPGKYVLIKGREVVGTFDTQNDAIDAGWARFGRVPIFTHKIVEHEEIMQI